MFCFLRYLSKISTIIPEQQWKLLENKTLINNAMTWQYHDIQLTLPNEGQENRIQEKGSTKFLTFRVKKNGEIGKRVTFQRGDSSGYQNWYRSPKDSDGWFTLRNTKLGSLLTAETSRSTKATGNFLQLSCYP